MKPIRVIDALPGLEGLYIRIYASEDDIPAHVKRDYSRHDWDERAIRYHSKEADNFWNYLQEQERKQQKLLSWKTIESDKRKQLGKEK